MKKKQRRKAFWMAPVAALAIAAIVVSILVFADSEPVAFTATLYSDVVRFEADGVASLRVTIYDLSENELWTSGQVMGDFVDWDRTNAQGERLANGYYVYIAQAWDVDDRLILNRTGKVVLLPGDQVELKAAPVVQREETNGISLGGDTRWSPTEASEPYWAHTGDHLYNTNSGLLGIGRTSPSRHGGYGNKVDIAGGIALNGETNSNVYLFAAFDNTTGALLDAIFYNGWGGADGHLLVDSAKEGADSISDNPSGRHSYIQTHHQGRWERWHRHDKCPCQAHSASDQWRPDRMLSQRFPGCGSRCVPRGERR